LIVINAIIIIIQGQQAKDKVHKIRDWQGIQKSSLVEEKSDMKRKKFEASALLPRRVKKREPVAKWMTNTMLAQKHNLSNRSKRSQWDFKSSYCEFRNKRVKCSNVEDSSGKQNEGREWVKSHVRGIFMEEAKMVEPDDGNESWHSPPGEMDNK